MSIEFNDKVKERTDLLRGAILVKIIEITKTFDERAPLIGIIVSGTYTKQDLEEYERLTAKIIELMKEEISFSNDLISEYQENDPTNIRFALELAGLMEKKADLAYQESHFADFLSGRGRSKDSEVLLLKHSVTKKLYLHLDEILSPKTDFKIKLYPDRDRDDSKN